MLSGAGREAWTIATTSARTASDRPGRIGAGSDTGWHLRLRFRGRRGYGRQAAVSARHDAPDSCHNPPPKESGLYGLRGAKRSSVIGTIEAIGLVRMNATA